MPVASNAVPNHLMESASRAAPKPPVRFRRSRKFFAILCWLYALAMIALYLVLRFAGDQWWIATLLLFGPNWLFALPLALLVPLAAFFRRRSLWPLLLGAFTIVAPVMDLCVPWRTLLPGAGNGPKLRVLTCNIHHSALDAKALNDELASAKPDIVALQEYSPKLNSLLFGKGEWYTLWDRELLIASRYPIRKIEDFRKRWSCPGSAVQYEISTPAGPVQFFNVHLASPHNSFSSALYRSPEAPDMIHENINFRLLQARELQSAIANIVGPVVLAGDFNMPAEGAVYRQTFSSLSDAFAQAGFGFGWTYFEKKTRTRIDHIFTGDGWRTKSCWVGPDVGSPHRPLIADLEWMLKAR